MTIPGLFPEPEHLELPAPPRDPSKRPPGMSAGRWLTTRQRLAIAKGKHPLAPTRTDSDHTCGSCVHRHPASGDHSWPKCDRWLITSGPATDCRAWWPACTQWEPRP